MGEEDLHHVTVVQRLIAMRIASIAVVTFSLLVSLNAITIFRCPPSLSPDGDWSNVQHVTDFKLVQDPNHKAKQNTAVHFCYDDRALQLKYECEDNNIISPYTDCNQPLYNSDVVEVFLTHVYSGPSVDLHHYLELEVSPNSVLYVSHITNPNLTCEGIQGLLVVCDQSGVVWTAQRKDAENSWWAFLSIPWGLIGGLPREGWSFSGNFFRIDTPHNNPQEFSCWQSTNSNPPCFHVPKYFAKFDFA